VASLLAACAASTPSANAPISLPDLPVEFTHCLGPAKLKHVAMNQAEVEKGWRRDRITLVVCKKKHEGLVSFYQDLQHRLTTPEH
jgi:hypothetical protein